MVKCKKILGVGVLCASLAITGSAVFAVTRNIDSYNLIIPRMGGNAYSSPLLKVSAESAVNHNKSVGGGKTIYSTIDFGATNVTSETTTTPGSRVVIPYDEGQNIANRNYRLMLETSLFETAEIQAQGSWSPDIIPK
jgi:hypothetical protein